MASDAEILEKLNETLGPRKGVDLFSVEGPRFRNLRRAAKDNGSQGVQEPSNHLTSSQRRQHEVKRSQYAPIRELYATLLAKAKSDFPHSGQYTAEENQINPNAFLSRTSPGMALRDLMINNPAIANAVLARITVGAEALSIAKGFSTDTMIAHPLHVFLHERKSMIDRVKKTSNFMQLIQKQERLVHRIGTTTDAVLSVPQGRIGEMEVFRCTHTETFKALWGAHVLELSKDPANQSTLSAPKLTFMLFEALIQMCNRKVIGGIPDGIRAFENICKIYPGKKIIQALDYNADLANHSGYFVN